MFGKEFYKDVWEEMQVMAEKGTISKPDMDLVLFTDDVNEAMEHITKYIRTNYKIKPQRKLWWLFEKN